MFMSFFAFGGHRFLDLDVHGRTVSRFKIGRLIL